MKPQDQQSDKGGQSPQQNPAPQPQDSQPQVVYMSRPMEPQKVQIGPEAMQRHQESRKKYPDLNLSEGEYVISAVRRHPIGLLQIWGVTGLVIVVLLAIVVFLTTGSFKDELGNSSFDSVSPMVVALPILLIMLLAFTFGFIASIVYNANRFYLTNESVIQQLQFTLFSKREQTVSLLNVEDASYTQNGVMPYLFNYGMIRLSTQGDETTYRFNYASSPQKQIAILNDAVESFKNGRPVDR